MGLYFQSGFGIGNLQVVSKTTTYAISIGDSVILCSGNAFTVTLPTAVGISGKEFQIKKTDSSLANIITIATTSAQTIDGAASTTLNTQNEELIVISDGANWVVENRYIPSLWTAYTPGTNGLGTVSNVNFQWRRDGGSIWVRGRLTAGTVTASEGRINLPTGVTSTTESSTFLVGNLARNGGTSSQIFYVLGPSALNYFLFGRVLGSDAVFTVLAANQMAENGETIGMMAQASVVGWNS